MSNIYQPSNYAIIVKYYLYELVYIKALRCNQLEIEEHKLDNV